MRVKGNQSPQSVTVEAYGLMPGYAEVRLRENIKQLSDNMFEHDEYVLHVKENDGLQTEIENNLADWLTTGRMLEVNYAASIVQDMKEALAILEVAE